MVTMTIMMTIVKMIMTTIIIKAIAAEAVIATATFVRDNAVRVVTVTKTEKVYEVQVYLDGDKSLSISKPKKFKTEDEALHGLGAESLDGYRYFFGQCRWTEVA